MSKILKNCGLDQYGAEPFEQQQFGTAGVKGVKADNVKAINCNQDIHIKSFCVFYVPSFQVVMLIELGWPSLSVEYQHRPISHNDRSRLAINITVL